MATVSSVNSDTLSINEINIGVLFFVCQAGYTVATAQSRQLANPDSFNTVLLLFFFLFCFVMQWKAEEK